MPQNDRYLALATLAETAAMLEHTLHDAILRCFKGREWMIHEMIRDAQASRLVQLFHVFYPETPAATETRDRLTQLLRFRNTVLHGLPSLRAGVPGEWTWHLESRRSKPTTLPTAAKMQEAAAEMAELASLVNDMARERPADYTPRPPADWDPLRLAD